MNKSTKVVLATVLGASIHAAVVFAGVSVGASLYAEARSEAVTTAQRFAELAQVDHVKAANPYDVSEVTAGDALTPQQAKAVTGRGGATYTLADGTVALIEAGQPLPESVKVDASARTAPVMPSIASFNQERAMGEFSSKTDATLKSLSAAGHKVMMVTPVLGFNDDNSFGFRWSAMYVSDGAAVAVNYTSHATQEQAFAVAQSFITSQGGSWELIVSSK